MTLLPLPTTRRLGLDGPEVAPLAWGMWRFAGRSRDQGARLVHSALDAGMNLLDTADIYGFDGSTGFGAAEALLGEVLAAEPGLRARMVLATKGGIRPPLPYDQSAAYLADAIDASLRRLRTDRIDLWQIHRPDILSHPHEVAAALDKAVAAGKVGHVGVSNFTQLQIAALGAFIGKPLATTQPEIGPLRIAAFENGELDQAMVLGLVPLAWSPLGGGRLADPRTARECDVSAALDEVAAGQGVSRTVAAYSWLMAHPAGIVPIVGTQQADRIAEAAQALTMRWTREQWYAVFAAARGEKLP
jgi:predicted oxidoreductase